MPLVLRYAARSDVGLVRSNNQDSAYAGPDLLVVADGMGGHAGGDVASAIAVGELSGLDGGHGDDATGELRARIGQAHTALVRRVAQDPGLAGMGTTVTALLRAGDRLALAHVGDSRGYRLRDGDLTQVTHDHTFVQGLVDAGRITPEEAERHPQRSVIMKVLGDSDTDTDPDLSWHEVRAGDRWLLCSDGLSGVVSDDRIAATLRDVGDVGACADRLVEQSLAAGAPDNVTVVVADVLDAATAGGGAVDAAQVVGAAGALTGTTPPEHAVGDDTEAGETGDGTDHGETGDDETDTDETGADGTGGGRRGRLWRVVGVLAVLALLVAGAAGAWAWGRQQYFVGAADGDVAIFRGLQQDLGPVVLSTVYEPQGLSTQDLPDYWRAQVEDRIGADDLAEARQVVSQLRLRSVECRQAASEAEAAAEPAPVPGLTDDLTDGPTDGAAGGVPGSPDSGTPAPTVEPAPEPQVPPGCEGVG